VAQIFERNGTFHLLGGFGLCAINALCSFLKRLTGRDPTFSLSIPIQWTGYKKVINPRIEVHRQIFTDKSTIGSLSIDGVFECWTLEDTCRWNSEKIKEKTAVPAGHYEVIIDWSTKFKKDLPHILDVPNFSGIRIHCGNSDEQTEGCILVGNTKEADWIGESRLAFDAFFPKLKRLLEEGRTYISIIGGR